MPGWILNVIQHGYSLQFARRPPRFRGVLYTTVPDDRMQILREEVRSLLLKDAIETVPADQSESGFYSRYFLVPKKDGGLRPILDLRVLNRALAKRPFKMLTARRIMALIRPGDWFISVDLKDAYFHIPIAPRHRPFLRFALDGTAYQYKVLPFGLSLAPRTFTKCADAALAPLRQSGIRILNYLDDWLILAQSEREITAHKTVVLQHLENLGFKINLQKSLLTPTQRIAFLGTTLDSLKMRAWLTQERALTVRREAASFKAGSHLPLKRFQKMLGLMAAASPLIPLGMLFMRPLQFWLKAKVPPRAWLSGRLLIKITYSCVKALSIWTSPHLFLSGTELGSVSRRKVVTTDASATGWGAHCDGELAFGAWNNQLSQLHINHLEMWAVILALRHFRPKLQHQHVLVRSDSMTVVSFINHQGGLRSRSLSRLAKRLLLWAHANVRSLKATHVPGVANTGADILSRNGPPPGEWRLHPQTVERIWTVFGRAEIDLFASDENAHCPIFFSRHHDALSQAWPACLLYAFPPVALLPQVLQRIRETKCAIILVAPFWHNQPWLPDLWQLKTSAPWPVPLRKDLLSQARGTIWHPQPELWNLHVWSLNGNHHAFQDEC